MRRSEADSLCSVLCQGPRNQRSLEGTAVSKATFGTDGPLYDVEMAAEIWHFEAKLGRFKTEGGGGGSTAPYPLRLLRASMRSKFACSQ